MEDIRSLYRRAKFGGPGDRATYADAIAEAARTDPVAYLSQLEYIICSGTGLDSFDRFMAERAPLPLAAMRSISEAFDAVTEVAKDKLVTAENVRYLAAAEKASAYLDANEHLLAMFEAFEAEVPSAYLESVMNDRLTYTQAIDRFGAAAVPDCLRGCFGETSMATVLEYAADHPTFRDPGMKQWLVEACRDLTDDPAITAVMERVQPEALGNVVMMLCERTSRVYREAVLTDEDLEVEYTEAEINSLRDHSEFQHYLVTALRSEDAIMRAWNEACRTDAELAPLIEEESCADIAAMLPTGQMVRSINEGRDQKTGKIPRFISKHHNLNYGEEDDLLGKSTGNDGTKSVDDYTRPAGDTASKSSSDDYVSLDDDETTSAPGNDRATTNYYYNYYNSFNRNHRDDHSSHHTDNSVNKRIRSDNVTAPKGKGSPDRTDDDDDTYSEGFKDFIGKVAKGIKGLVTMRKSLANLQLRDRPEASKIKVPPHLIGLGIPLSQIKPVRETVTLDDILDLGGLGQVITEAGDSPFGLSKNDVKNIVNRLRLKFNAEILFISDTNPTITSMIGPAAVVETDRATIDKMVKGGKLDRVPSFAVGDDNSNFKKVILVNAKMMAAWKLARPRDLEVVISHEYGHVLTYDQLTQRDWLEYTCKQQAIVALVQMVNPSPDTNVLAEMNYFYYKLKPEVLANRAANIDPKELTKVLFGKQATGRLTGLDLDTIVNWNVPDEIIDQTARAIRGETNFSQQDIVASIKVSTEVYGRAITDATVRDQFMKTLNDQAKQLTEQFSESTESADDLFEERSHGKLDSSFRMAANVKNGHMIKIVFDLNPQDVSQIGDHTDRMLRNAERDRERIKNIRREGYNDFSSVGTVKAIIDLDTGERLREVRAIGIIGNGGTRFKIPEKYRTNTGRGEPFSFGDLPVKTREVIAKEANLNPKDAITYKVGEKESKPTYKATTAFKSTGGVYNGQMTVGKGVGRAKHDMSVAKALAEIEKEFNQLKTKYGEDKLKATGFYYAGCQGMLKHFKDQIAKYEGEKFAQTIASARYHDTYESLASMLAMLKSELKKTIKESTDFALETGTSMVGMEPDHGFNVITGEWTTDEIVEKLIKFLRSTYFEDETKVIAAVKELAEDEHHILGNVVMEPGLETMWTDRYHLEEMLLGPDGNVIFEADTGETILFEHIIGSNTFDPAKVTWGKLEALIDQYRMDRSIIDELRRTNGDDIAGWGRIEWGKVASEIFEKFTFPELKKLNLPPDCQLEPYCDGNAWDDTIGARLVFTDLHDKLRKFNDGIAQGGNVTVKSTNLLGRESVDMLSTVFEVGSVGYTDGIEIMAGTMTEKELRGRLAEELARTYQPQLHRLYSDLDRVIRHDRRIVGNLKADYLGNFTWNDPSYFENACLIGTRNEGAIFTASHFRNLDRAGGTVTMETIQTFFREHAIPMELLSGLGTEPGNWDRSDLEGLDQAIFRKHTWPIIRSAVNLPSNVNLYKIGTYDYDGFGIQFTDVTEVADRITAAVGDGGTVRIKVTPIGEDEWLESTKVEPEEEDPDADPERPTSDHPVKDTIQDIDRILTKKGAAAKKKVNDAINVGRVVTKPVKRTIGWIDNIINRLKDANETKVKEQLADPHSRSAIFKAIKTAIGAGALYKAGLLLNPIFLFLAVTNTASKRRKNIRLRSEVIGQLKAELEVTEEKIRDADRAGDNSAKYKLMRFKTELEKKLIRVGGGKEIARII